MFKELLSEKCKSLQGDNSVLNYSVCCLLMSFMNTYPTQEQHSE